MMKIAAFHNFLNQRRGGELAFLNMVAGLKRIGHDIDVFTLQISSEFAAEIENKNIPQSSLKFKEWKLRGPLSILNPLLPTINLVRALSSFIKLAKHFNDDYDIVFLNHYSYSPLLLPFLKIPTVYYCHEAPRIYYEPHYRDISKLEEITRKILYLIPKLVDRYCVKYADLVLVNSHYSREYVWRIYGVFPKTNYYGVDLEKFKRHDIKKEHSVLSIGAFHPLKAQDFVIRSIGLIPKNKRPRLVIVSTNPNEKRQELRSLASDNGVDLEVKYNLTQDELAREYNKVKITAIAAVMEPFGLTAIESMACGTPVVAVSEAGPRESVTEDTGVLTDRDERDFAKAMEYVIDHPEIAIEMGVKGRERVEKYFTWDTCTRNLERNMKQLLDDFNASE